MIKKIINIGLLVSLLTLAVGVYPFSLVASAANTTLTPGVDYVPGEVLVGFKSGVTPNSLFLKTNGLRNGDKLLAAFSKSKIASLISQVGLDQVYLFKTESADSDIAAIVKKLSTNPLVEYAEPNWKIKGLAVPESQRTPNDNYFTNQWNMHNDDAERWGVADTDIDAPEAWSILTDASLLQSPVVGVIDSGIDYRHPDLRHNLWVNQAEVAAGLAGPFGANCLRFIQGIDSSENGIYADACMDGEDNDNNGCVDDFYGCNTMATDGSGRFHGARTHIHDYNGHGTHVSGIIGASGNNGEGVTGVAWRAKLAAIKVLDHKAQGSISSAVAGIVYATANNFRITNNSWGCVADCEQNFTLDPVGLTLGNTSLRKAIWLNNLNGSLFVAAAGSNGNAAPVYPAAYPHNPTVSPVSTVISDSSALYANIVSVGASNSRDLMPSWSNFGPNVDLVAPGEFIMSTISRICIVEDGYSNICNNEGYNQLDGTSMSAPHVAGAAALFWTLHPGLNHLTVKESILKTTDKKSAFENTVSGGRLNLDRLLRFDLADL